MTNEVVVKETATQWIASVREVIPGYPAVGKLFQELFSTLGPAALSGVTAARWHDLEPKEQDVDAEAGVYLQHPIEASGRVKVYELPAATVASIVHNGAYNRLREAYGAVLGWIEANGYRVAGPIRELYVHISMPVRQDDETNVTEIQVPVEKVGETGQVVKS